MSKVHFSQHSKQNSHFGHKLKDLRKSFKSPVIQIILQMGTTKLSNFYCSTLFQVQLAKKTSLTQLQTLPVLYQIPATNLVSKRVTHVPRYFTVKSLCHSCTKSLLQNSKIFRIKGCFRRSLE
jgi:hypothetical protein